MGVSQWARRGYYSQGHTNFKPFSPLSAIPSIDLHPEKIRGDGPEAALRACRDFLDRSLAAGHREVRIITGLGLRGDGTPRLRKRVEEQVLGGYHSRISGVHYEQGGAVLRVQLQPGNSAGGPLQRRRQRAELERNQRAAREERLLVAWDRLDAAAAALDEGDLRRCRLKLNQLAREHGWEEVSGPLDETRAADLLASHRRRLSDLDAGGAGAP